MNFDNDCLEGTDYEDGYEQAIKDFEKIIDEWMFEQEKKSNGMDFAVIGYKSIEELKQKIKLK